MNTPRAMPMPSLEVYALKIDQAIGLPVGRDSVEPVMGLVVQAGGSTESRPTKG